MIYYLRTCVLSVWLTFVELNHTCFLLSLSVSVYHIYIANGGWSDDRVLFTNVALRSLWWDIEFGAVDNRPTIERHSCVAVKLSDSPPPLISIQTHSSLCYITFSDGSMCLWCERGRTAGSWFWRCWVSLIWNVHALLICCVLIRPSRRVCLMDDCIISWLPTP